MLRWRSAFGKAVSHAGRSPGAEGGRRDAFAQVLGEFLRRDELAEAAACVDGPSDGKDLAKGPYRQIRLRDSGPSGWKGSVTSPLPALHR
jgi:hypothetical protein